MPRQSFNEDTDTLAGSEWSVRRLNDITLHSINLGRPYDELSAAPGRQFGGDANRAYANTLSDKAAETSEPENWSHSYYRTGKRGKHFYMYMTVSISWKDDLSDLCLQADTLFSPTLIIGQLRQALETFPGDVE